MAETVRHINLITSPTPGTITTVSLGAPAGTLLIDNRFASSKVYVSFDGANNFKTLFSGDIFDVDVSGLTFIHIKSDGASIPVEMLSESSYT